MRRFATRISRCRRYWAVREAPGEILDQRPGALSQRVHSDTISRCCKEGRRSGVHCVEDAVFDCGARGA